MFINTKAVAAFKATLGVFILTQSLNISSTHADSVVKTFAAPNTKGSANTPLSEFEKQSYTSDLYTVRVKSVERNETFDDIQPVGATPPIFHHHNYQYSFTHKSVNDIAVNNGICYQHESTAAFNDLESELSSNPGVDCNFGGSQEEMQKAFDDVMTYTNNWTSFDIGHEDSLVGGESAMKMGTARVLIQANVGNSSNNQVLNEIVSDIRPAHFVAKGSNGIDPALGKFIKVHYDGVVNVATSHSPTYRRIIILDVAQPQDVTDTNGSNAADIMGWSGQFYVGFDRPSGDSIFKTITNPLTDSEFQKKTLQKHPLFVFANSLPAWYYDAQNNRSNYDGCPKHSVNGKQYYSGPSGVEWTPGQVRSVYYPSYNGNGNINDHVLGYNGNDADQRHICIPGGVILKGRFVHSHHQHYGNTPNIKEDISGVKIVGRGILSGKDIMRPKNSSWNGHLIDIRSRRSNNNNIATNATSCYMLPDTLNCVEGITLVDSPKAGIDIQTGRLDVENVKVMNWHIQGDGISTGSHSQIKNVFVKGNDDNLLLKKSMISIENATVWRQNWGSVVQMSWSLKDTNEGGATLKGSGYPSAYRPASINGLNVIRYDRSLNTINPEINVADLDTNNAVITVSNLMGGTIKNHLFRNIVVEDHPYQFLSLQLDDRFSYKEANRTPDQQDLDGTGIIKNLQFRGVFSKHTYNFDRKSRLSVEDETLGIDVTHEDVSREVSNLFFRNVCFGNSPGYEQGIVNWGNIGQNSGTWSRHYKNYIEEETGITNAVHAYVCHGLRPPISQQGNPLDGNGQCNYENYRVELSNGTPDSCDVDW